MTNKQICAQVGKAQVHLLHGCPPQTHPLHMEISYFYVITLCNTTLNENSGMVKMLVIATTHALPL